MIFPYVNPISFTCAWYRHLDVTFVVRFIPSWFPGAGFKRMAAVWRKQFSELDAKPHAWAKEQIVRSLNLVSVTL
jgi:hypothetical protein